MTMTPAFMPGMIVGARQQRTFRRFLTAGADDPARARTLAELDVSEDHLFRRLVKAGVVVATSDGRWWLSPDGLARWHHQRRIYVGIAITLIILGLAVALLLGN